MSPLKAHVLKGQLVLDEPTDLPEGRVVELIPVDAARDDDLDDEEREGLRLELEASIADADAGHVVSAEEMLKELRAMQWESF